MISHPIILRIFYFKRNAPVSSEFWPCVPLRTFETRMNVALEFVEKKMSYSPGNVFPIYKAFSHHFTAAILVFQTKPVGIELFFM